MRNADGSPAVVDLVGAIEVISLMHALGFDEDVDEVVFWKKRAILEEWERRIRASEKERCEQIVKNAKRL